MDATGLGQKVSLGLFQRLHHSRKRNQLIKRLAPSVNESHLGVLPASGFVGMNHRGGVLRAVGVRGQCKHRGESKTAHVFCLGDSRRQWTKIGAERIGPDQFFVGDDFEITADIRKLLSLGRAHHGTEDAPGAQIDHNPLSPTAQA